MNNWFNFYKDKQNDSYLDYIGTKYSPFLSLLQKEVDKKQVKRIMEIGCGLGSITKLLKTNKARVVVDKNKMLINFINLKAEKVVRDITKPFIEKVDLIHSHGLLEHLSDFQIRQTIREELKCSNLLVHYVPSNKYTYKSFGDERLLTPKQWKEICSPSNIIEFNNGLDLILIWTN